MGTVSKRQETEVVANMVRFFPYGRMTTEQLQPFVEHPERLTEILLNALSATVENIFQSLLANCRQDWKNDNITEEHFPLVDDGTGDKEILEYGFDRTVTGYEAEKELKRLGYKFVGMRRAMEYVAKNPDAQKAHPLIVIGAQWQSGGNVLVPCFDWDGSKRCFYLFWLGALFFTHCRFLVVRE